MVDFTIYKYLYVFFPWILWVKGFSDDITNVPPQGSNSFNDYVDSVRDDEGLASSPILMWRAQLGQDQTWEPRLSNRQMELGGCEDDRKYLVVGKDENKSACNSCLQHHVHEETECDLRDGRSRDYEHLEHVLDLEDQRSGEHGSSLGSSGLRVSQTPARPEGEDQPLRANHEKQD